MKPIQITYENIRGTGRSKKLIQDIVNYIMENFVNKSILIIGKENSEAHIFRKEVFILIPKSSTLKQLNCVNNIEVCSLKEWKIMRGKKFDQIFIDHAAWEDYCEFELTKIQNALLKDK